MKKNTGIKDVVEAEEIGKDVVVANSSVDSNVDDFLAQEAQEDAGVEYIPALTIVQKGEDSGKLFSKELAMTWDEIDATLIKITDSRVLWPAEYDEDNQPLCRSQDGIRPSCDIKKEPEDDDSEMLEPMNDDCESCSYSKWTKNKKGGPEAPRCRAVRNLLIVDLESNIPFFLSLSSTALTPLKAQLEKPLKFRKMALSAQRCKAGLPAAHNCMFKFTIGTSIRKSSKGDSYIPKFTNIEAHDQDMQDFMIQVAYQLRSFSSKNIKEAGDTGNQPDSVEEENDF